MQPASRPGRVAVLWDITERRAWEDNLVEGATHDPLAGLLHRGVLADCALTPADPRYDGAHGPCPPPR